MIVYFKEYDLEQEPNNRLALRRNGVRVNRPPSLKGDFQVELDMLWKLLLGKKRMTSGELNPYITAKTVHEYMNELGRVCPGLFKYEKARKGNPSIGGYFELLPDVKIRVREDRSMEPLERALAARLLRSVAASDNTLSPVLHTLALIKQPNGSYREATEPDQHRIGKVNYADLTGYGEAEALRRLHTFCHALGIHLEQCLPAHLAGDDLFRKSNVCWLGSPFNPSHPFHRHMYDLELWDAEPKCQFVSIHNALEVHYPDLRTHGKTITETVNRWPPARGRNDKRFALLRYARTRPTNRNAHDTGMLVMAGTDTRGTLFAMEILTGAHRSGLLESAMQNTNGDLRFEALFELGASSTDRLTRMVWPHEVVFEGNEISATIR